MSVNASKISQARFWQKWYRSGAVKHQIYPVGSLKIDAIGEHLRVPAKGHMTLSLGSRIVNSGPGWSVDEPLCAVVVPTSPKYKLGETLQKIPAAAMPATEFFKLVS